jgi:signal transduction histidine kinase
MKDQRRACAESLTSADCPGMTSSGQVRRLSNQKEMVNIAIAGGELLVGKINDLLDVEKLESGALPLDQSLLDASDLVDSAAGQIASLCAGKNLPLVRQVVTGMPPFYGDKSKLSTSWVML